MTKRPGDLRGRRNFGRFLNDLGLTGVAVEIGTHRGAFARELLSRWKGSLLYCVDSYLPGYRDPSSDETGDREADFAEAKRVLRGFGDQVVFFRELSRIAVRKLRDGSVDFVYVDGDHHYETVLEDLQIWYPKLRRGGVLAGHDIRSGGKPGNGWDRFVRPAVEEFAREKELKVHLVREDGLTNWSYYMIV